MTRCFPQKQQKERVMSKFSVRIWFQRQVKLGAIYLCHISLEAIWIIFFFLLYFGSFVWIVYSIRLIPMILCPFFYTYILLRCTIHSFPLSLSLSLNISLSLYCWGAPWTPPRSVRLRRSQHLLHLLFIFHLILFAFINAHFCLQKKIFFSPLFFISSVCLLTTVIVNLYLTVIFFSRFLSFVHSFGCVRFRIAFPFPNVCHSFAWIFACIVRLRAFSQKWFKQNEPRAQARWAE